VGSFITKSKVTKSASATVHKNICRVFPARNNVRESNFLQQKTLEEIEHIATFSCSACWSFPKHF